MIDLGTYKDRFAESGQRVLEHAIQESKRRDQNYIAVEHILNALSVEEADLFNSTMRDLSLDPRSVRVLIEKRLENSRYQNVNKAIRIAPETIELFKKAMDRARAQGGNIIEATDLFMALSQDENSVLMHMLRNLGANPETVVEQVRARVRTREQQEEEYKKKFELPPYLKHFGVSLNRLARADKLPPTIGRERVIQQMIEILCHRERANSPMLVGEPGVGQTAVVKVDEPSIAETREILFGLRPRLERNYSVTISDDAINTALEMAPKYIRNLHLPDKAIGWLDTAAVKVEINEPEAMVVKPEHVIDVISQESRIPRDMIFRDTTDRFGNMEEDLGHR